MPWETSLESARTSPRRWVTYSCLHLGTGTEPRGIKYICQASNTLRLCGARKEKEKQSWEKEMVWLCDLETEKALSSRDAQTWESPFLVAAWLQYDITSFPGSPGDVLSSRKLQGRPGFELSSNIKTLWPKGVAEEEEPLAYADSLQVPPFQSAFKRSMLSCE